MLNTELVGRLAIPGLPEWSGLVVLLFALMVVVAFALMPFSVFGLKSRLDAIEVQLDEVQGEIRSLAMRLPEPGMRRRVAMPEDAYDEPPLMDRPVMDRGEPSYREDREPRMTPPIPPPASWPESGRATGRDTSRRTEPRLGGPRL